MNLVDVIVASTLVLGSCSGAAQLGATCAQTMSQGQQNGQDLERFEAQFLAVTPVLQVAHGLPSASTCADAARWMQQQLSTQLPPLQGHLQRQISLTPTGEQVELVLRSGGGMVRRRLLSPLAMGLCAPGPALALMAQEGANAAP